MGTVMEMKELDRQADAAGLSYLPIMENAGRAAVERLLFKMPDLRTVSILV